MNRRVKVIYDAYFDRIGILRVKSMLPFMGKYQVDFIGPTGHGSTRFFKCHPKNWGKATKDEGRFTVVGEL